ncbi:hypothetical protein AVEN_259539-1 [Araneus ventricosus]|uniref:Uncharacterized protein n=1 Tax=Araneus ventricosus TaxID=182803 RepID=A0A4Y2NV59_ARAVE|nr:hypothetical protein AVEN_259539-1 [Araneus ventricosus]
MQFFVFSTFMYPVLQLDDLVAYYLEVSILRFCIGFRPSLFAFDCASQGVGNGRFSPSFFPAVNRKGSSRRRVLLFDAIASPFQRRRVRAVGQRTQGMNPECCSQRPFLSSGAGTPDLVLAELETSRFI